MTEPSYHIEAILQAVRPRTNHIGEVQTEGVTIDVIMDGCIVPIDASASLDELLKYRGQCVIVEGPIEFYYSKKRRETLKQIGTATTVKPMPGAAPSNTTTLFDALPTVCSPHYNNHPDTNRPITIWRGIDTIKIGLGIKWANAEALSMLAALQVNVREKPEEYRFFIGNQPWAILPYGRKKYRYGIQHGQLTMYFSEEEFSDHTPTCMVEAYPQAIAGKRPCELLETIDNTLDQMGGTRAWDKISELHLTTDTHCPRPLQMPDIYDHNHLHKWITLARNVRRYTQEDQKLEALFQQGRTLTSIRIGGEQLHVRIYNKQIELKQHPEKAWERGLWNNPLAGEVTRTEFQFRREKLKEFQIEGMATLENKIPGTWAYLTQVWLTLNTEHSHKGNRDATPSEFWQQVQAAWTTATPNRPIPSVGENARQRILQGFGNLVSAAAILDRRDEECIADLMKRWKQEHPEPWYDQVAKRQAEIELLKGKLCIRDQGAEMELAEQAPDDQSSQPAEDNVPPQE